MADRKHTKPTTEIGARLKAGLATRLKAGLAAPLTDVVTEITTTRLVPLWYAPLLFCGVPGKPNAFPAHDAPSAHKLGRCLVRWITLIANAVERGELLAREPDGWSVIDDDDPVTSDCLLYWGELDYWAINHHGLSSGCPTVEELKDMEARLNPASPQIPDDWRTDETLLKSDKQDRAVLAAIKAKGWNPLGVPDGEKGTVQRICEADYPELFAPTSFETTWKRGLGKGSWRMLNHASYAHRGRK